MDGDESFQEDYVIWETLHVDNVAAEEEVPNFSEVARCNISYSLDETSENMDAFTFGLEGDLQSDRDEDDMTLSPVTSNECRIPSNTVMYTENIHMTSNTHCSVQDKLNRAEAGLLQVPKSIFTYVKKANKVEDNFKIENDDLKKHMKCSDSIVSVPVIRIEPLPQVQKVQKTEKHTPIFIDSVQEKRKGNCGMKSNKLKIISNTDRNLTHTNQKRNICNAAKLSSILPLKEKSLGQNKIPKIKIVTVNKSKSNQPPSFEKIKNVEIVEKTSNSNAKVYVINNGKLVEKNMNDDQTVTKKFSQSRNSSSKNLMDLEANKHNKVLQYSGNLDECDVKSSVKLGSLDGFNVKSTQISSANLDDISSTSLLIPCTINNKTKCLLSTNDINQKNGSNSINTSSNFHIEVVPQNCNNINQLQHTTVPISGKEDNIFQHVKLLSTKEEIVAPEPMIEEPNAHIMDNVCDINITNCPDVIFTSENAQSNEDISGLNSEDMSIPGDMVSVFEVSANTVLKSYEEQTSNKTLQSETNTTVQPTDSHSGIFQSESSTFTFTSQENKNIIKSMNLPINVMPLTEHSSAESTAYSKNSGFTVIETEDTSEEAKIVMTKGQYYIQRKQKRNNDYVIVLTPLTKEMMMPLLPMNRSDVHEESTYDGSNLVEPDVHFNVCAESTVRTTPSRIETEAEKRERVRLAKRALRMDPNYRARESAKSKIRMQKVRMDPEYREKERMKDRMRRSKSRKQNVTQRAQEKERDKAYQYYKRLQRNIHGAVMPVFLEEEVSCEINEDVVVTATVDEETDDVESSLSL